MAKIAVLATDGFEQSELEKPVAALKEAGHTPEIISLKSGKIKGWKDTDWGDTVKVDQVVADANADDYEMLLLPGGVMNPDKLREDEDAVAFIKKFDGKPVAAICHGPWPLINAGLVEGKQMTSYKSIQEDLKNAGAKWEDSEVVIDGNLITSRQPDDIPAFNKAILEALEK